MKRAKFSQKNRHQKNDMGNEVQRKRGGRRRENGKNGKRGKEREREGGVKKGRKREEKEREKVSEKEQAGVKGS